MLFLLIFLCLTLPVAALWAERTFPWAKKVGAVILCYAAGMGLRLLGLTFPEGQLADVYGPAAILAIPLVLFSANIRAWIRLAGKTLLSYAFAAIGAIAGSLLAFGGVWNKLPEAAAMTGMTTGVYTGGTPNLNAIGIAMQVPESLIVQMNLADTLVSLPYMLLAMGPAYLLLGKILHKYPAAEDIPTTAAHVPTPLSSGQKIQGALLSMGLAILCLGLSSALSWWITGRLADGLLVSSITVIGLALSAIPAVGRVPYSYETGTYMLLVFCTGIGLAIDFTALSEDLALLVAGMALAAYTAVSIHVILARFCKIDADTVLITSVAAVLSPLFVAPIARSIGNKEIIPAGMTTGVVGFAVGNIVGLTIAHVLS